VAQRAAPTSTVLIPLALKPLLVPLASLTPYPKNAQVHDAKSVDAMCRALREFGWTDPAIVWPSPDGKTYFAAGHRRNLAAVRLGMASIPAVARPEWTEAQFRAYVIWDNQSTKQEPWDFALLKDELVDLDDGQFDLTLTGFERNEVYALVHGDGGELAEQDAAMAGMDEDTVTVIVLKTEAEDVMKWLANGQLNTPAGRGRGVLKRMADERSAG
jgi:ParB-like chromosome segregation protein Spo0J